MRSAWLLFAVVLSGCATVDVLHAEPSGGTILAGGETPNVDAARYLAKACPHGYRIVSDDAVTVSIEGTPMGYVSKILAGDDEPATQRKLEVNYVCDRPVLSGARIAR